MHNPLIGEHLCTVCRFVLGEFCALWYLGRVENAWLSGAAWEVVWHEPCRTGDIRDPAHRLFDVAVRVFRVHGSLAVRTRPGLFACSAWLFPRLNLCAAAFCHACNKAEAIMSDGGNKLITDIEGTVKWFDPKKGFGFIVGPEKQDIFVHYSKIEGDGFRVLTDGSNVKYSAELTDRGWHATKVVRTDATEVVVVPRKGYSRSPRR